MEHLYKLFGSPARVKLLRLFMFNPLAVFDRDSVVTRARITPETASKELAALARAGIVSRKTFYKEIIRPGGSATKKRKTIGWVADQHYPYREQLSSFLRDTLVVSYADIRKRLRGVGTIRLLVLSGFLIGERDAGLDLLVVGDRLDGQGIHAAVKLFEAECGREIRYAVLATDEFQYRRRVRDKLVRDVMDFPHQALIDRLVSNT
jgi:hypothetical protein